jgi:hypothetical protein
MKGFETAKESVSMSDKEETVTGHSDPEKRGGFFGRILQKTTESVKDFFNDEENN